MNPRFAILALLLLGALLSSPRLGQTASSSLFQEQLRYNFRYSCNGDTIVVIRCRHQSDTPEFPQTRPENDYCSVIYPDRPKVNGIQVQDVELYGDVVKKLQACSAPNRSSTTSSRPTGPSSTATKPNAPGGTSAADYIVQGDNYRQAKKYPEAVEAFKKSISIEPSIGAYSRLGVVYLDDLKQYPEALAAFEVAIRLEPDSATAHFNLASAFYGLKQYDKTITPLKEAIRLDPAHAASWNLLGLVYWRLDQYAESEKAHNEAVRLNPNNARFRFNLGMTYVEFGRKEQALEVYKSLQGIDEARAKTLYDEINTSYAKPDNDIGNLDLGISFLRRGQDFYVDALRPLRRAVLLKPDPDTSGQAHYLIGEILKDQNKPTQATGEFEQAVAALQQAIRLNPRDADSYYWLGTVDVELGRKADALRVYKTLQSINPAKAKELYEEINKK